MFEKTGKILLKVFCSIEAYDPVSQKSSISKARKEWRRLYRSDKILKEEFEAFEDILAEGEYCPTLLKRSELERIFRQHFKIICIKHGSSRFLEYSPIYCLKPK